MCLGLNFELVLRSKVPEVVSSNSSAVSRKILSNLAASFPKVKVQPSENVTKNLNIKVFILFII